ncbi:MAG TPA: hypothetical protein PK185_10890 [Cyclobacteriaceae bacterium]|nr:hypothetical protein [Cyclobacteriaceae bacterium]
MFSFKQRSLLLLLFVLLSACSPSLPVLDGVDLKIWKEDKDGCKGDRSKMIEAITQEKEKLKSLSEMEIIQLLGRPDENDLLQRSQKFYVYYLEPGPHCDPAFEESKKLILRMNALGLTKEVQIK